MVAPRSESDTCAVIPTAVPFAAFSASLPADDAIRSLYVTGVQTCALPIATANVVLLVEPSLDVAKTVMLWLVELSASSSVPSATVTMPLLAPIRSEERRVGKEG